MTLLSPWWRQLAIPEGGEEGSGDEIGGCAGIAAIAVGAEPEIEIGNGFVVCFVARLASVECLPGQDDGFGGQFGAAFAGNQAIAMLGDQGEMSVDDGLGEGPAVCSTGDQARQSVVEHEPKIINVLAGNEVAVTGEAHSREQV